MYHYLLENLVHSRILIHWRSHGHSGLQALTGYLKKMQHQDTGAPTLVATPCSKLVEECCIEGFPTTTAARLIVSATCQAVTNTGVRQRSKRQLLCSKKTKEW